MASLAVANTYDRVGIREDLSDTIFNIDPTDTPFVTMAGTAKATQTKHEWQTDTLAAAGDSKVEQGAAAPGTAAAATVRVYNECQINAKDASVSGTAEEVNKAGRKSELAYQLAKRGKEIRLDMDWACVNTPNVRVTGASGTAAEISNIYAWIGTNTVVEGASTSATGDGSDISDLAGTADALAEVDITTSIQSAWTQGGKPTVVMCSPAHKAAITAFVGRSTAASTVTEADKKTIFNAVDWYQSDFGMVQIVPNRQFRNTSDSFVAVLDPSMWAIAMLRPFKTIDLAVTGDATSKELLVEWTLESRNEAASALILDLIAA